MPLRGGSAAVATQNLLIHGDFPAQATGDGPFTSVTGPANNDDTYLFDNWTYLAAAADGADVSRVGAGLPALARGKARLDIETANTKVGLIQIIESSDCAAILGGYASLSFDYQSTGASIGGIKACVLSWVGAVDAVTSDVVSAWGADGVTPTFVAGWTAENTPVAIVPSGSWQTARIQGIPIDTPSAVNVAVFIWTDDATLTVGDFLEITKVKLEPGSACTPWAAPDVVAETNRRNRLFEVLGPDANGQPFGCGTGQSTTVAIIAVPYTPKRIAQPGVQFLQQASDFQGYVAAGVAATAVVATVVGRSMVSVSLTIGSASFSVGFAVLMLAATTTARIRIDARL